MAGARQARMVKDTRGARLPSSHKQRGVGQNRHSHSADRPTELTASKLVGFDNERTAAYRLGLV
jgi:hypothetical protein